MEKKDQIAIWLKKLEQESWQLELLVSGFTIFLLISAYDGLIGYAQEFQFHFDPQGTFYGATIMLLYVISACILVLIVNLVLHLLFRGFWIGAIGLRSVGPVLSFQKLNYHTYFADRIEKTMVSMDDLIVRLDRLCSVIFSFTFLIIFLFLSFFIYIMAFALVVWVLKWLQVISPDWLTGVVQVILVIVILFWLLGGIMYMFDSLSLGLLKKIKWLRKVYYPIYVLFSTITLSFLYRSIYYNLIAKFPKAIIRLILVLYVLVIIFLPFFELDDYRYFPDNFTTYAIDTEYYDDQRLDKSYITAASIPSMSVKDGFLPLFVRYNVSDNVALAQSCPEFEPAKKGGLKHGIDIGKGNILLTNPDVEEPFPEKALDCLLDFYSFSIDNKLYQPDKAFFYIHPNKDEKGVLMMVNIQNLPIGPHSIKVSRQILQDSVLKKEDYANIPFWRH